VLDDAGLLVREFAGVEPSSVVPEEGDDIADSLQGAGLMVVGLSSRWRKEGLGPTRAAIARSQIAPVLFVRRGTRPGALAPRDEVTRFTWSSANMGGLGAGGLVGGVSEEPAR
jgi:hypothetical protein